MTFNLNDGRYKPYNNPTIHQILPNNFLNQYLTLCLQIVVASIYLMKHQNLIIEGIVRSFHQKNGKKVFLVIAIYQA